MEPANNETLPPQPASDNDRQPSPGNLGPELVRQVADRVYAMLRRDMQLERERQRPMTPGENYG